MREIMKLIEDEIDHLTKNDPWRKGCVWEIIEYLEKLEIKEDYFKKLIKELRRRVNYTVKTSLVAYLFKTYVFLQTLEVLEENK